VASSLGALFGAVFAGCDVHPAATTQPATAVRNRLALAMQFLFVGAIRIIGSFSIGDFSVAPATSPSALIVQRSTAYLDLHQSDGHGRRYPGATTGMTISLHIHGAAGTVTGSCYRLRTPEGELLVECGMFQGPRSLRALNYRHFPFEASKIKAVLLTHAHVDHTGLFPKLALAGFRGKAWTTEATRDLLRWLLPDAGAIQENDVDRLNRRNSRRAEPHVSPIFTRADAEASLALLAPHPYEDWFEPLAGVRARLRNAGHILGSARDGRWVAILSKAAVTPRLDAAQATAPRDWHNDYAALLLDLRNALLQEADDRRRQELLGEVRRLIDAHRATEATGAKDGAKRSA
jgi:hypothetical protein